MSGKHKRPARETCNLRGGAIMMTAPKTTSGDRLPDNSLPLESPSNGEMVLATPEREPRSEAATAGRKRRKTSCYRAIVPAKGKSPIRVMESIATRVLTPGATLGHIRQAQRAPCRAGRTGRLHHLGRRAAGLRAHPRRSRWWPGARRAVDTPRPGAAVMGRAVSSATARTSDRRDSPPSLFGHVCAPNRGGVHLPTNAPIERCQMPHILRFHDTDEGPVSLPDASQVGHAAAWAGERGYWDVATCLMELAHALADLETPAPPLRACALCGQSLGDVNCPDQCDCDGGAGQRCEHGYLAVDNVHIGTGGVCDLSAGTGV